MVSNLHLVLTIILKSLFLLRVERQARIFENEIRAYLACIQKNLNDGMPEVNLPPLNPFKADDISLELGKLAPELLRYFYFLIDKMLNILLKKI